MGGVIVCSMPGCNTTAGCQCQNRAGIPSLFGQIQKDAAASPTPFFAESAKNPDHIVDANKMVPAGIPSEEIRRIIDDAMNSAIPETWEVIAHATARLEALFAPILAEKEREIERASEGRAAFAARALAAEAVLDAERERCAKIAETWGLNTYDAGDPAEGKTFSGLIVFENRRGNEVAIAAAIRAGE